MERQWSSFAIWILIFAIVGAYSAQVRELSGSPSTNITTETSTLNGLARDGNSKDSLIIAKGMVGTMNVTKIGQTIKLADSVGKTPDAFKDQTEKKIVNASDSEILKLPKLPSEEKGNLPQKPPLDLSKKRPE